MATIKEFKEFINRGNVVDLAVGVVIGAAFGKIVTSLVNDLIMPPIGMLMSGVNFKDIKINLKDASVDGAGVVVPPVSINIGNFIQILIEFMIVAFAIFMLVKFINNMRKRDEAAAPPPPPNDELLLTEIR